MARIVVVGALGVVGRALADYFSITGNRIHTVVRNDIKSGANIVGLKDALLDWDQNGSGFIFVCVPTPSNENGSIDLSFVTDVTHNIGDIVKSHDLNYGIVYKSTMVPGSTDEMYDILSNYTDGFSVAYNPEFLRQRFALNDTVNPSRIVVGSDEVAFANEVMELYKYTVAPKFVFNSFEAAELVKYYANAYYAARISFFNQMSLFSRNWNCDHKDIVDAIVADKTVGVHGSDPVGKSYGGNCLIKDLSAIIHCGMKNNIDVRLLSSVERMNDLIRKTEGNKNITEWCR